MDTIFINWFMVELIIVLIGIGPENHFNKLFSVIDCVLVVTGFILQFIEIPTHGDGLLRFFRIYNASFLV